MAYWQILTAHKSKPLVSLMEPVVVANISQYSDDFQAKQWLRKSLGVNTTEIHLFPITPGNIHWILVWVNTRTNHLYTCNSKGNFQEQNPQFTTLIRRIRECYHEIHGRHLMVTRFVSEQQPDSWNCGTFVMWRIRQLWHSYNLRKLPVQHTPERLRNHIRYELTNHKYVKNLQEPNGQSGMQGYS